MSPSIDFVWCSARALTVDSGLLPQANGSSRLRLVTGGTDVLAAVKAEVAEPLPGHPAQGRLECSVECWSSASPQFEGRGAAEINAELTRTLSRLGFLYLLCLVSLIACLFCARRKTVARAVPEKDKPCHNSDCVCVHVAVS